MEEVIGYKGDNSFDTPIITTDELGYLIAIYPDGTTEYLEFREE